jgi:hypothetical protein
MSITGSLAEFSLPEIFQFIEKGKKTGLLSFRSEAETSTTSIAIHYIWVYQGKVVAAANQLDEQGLVKLINQRQWVSDRVVSKLAQLSPTDRPFGSYLKNQGVLRTEQLKQLFFAQVLQQLQPLLQLKNGIFNFEQDVPLPMREMTGLSISVGVPKLFAMSKKAKALRPDVWKSTGVAATIAQRSLYSGQVRKPYRGKSLSKKDLHSVVA